jgi:hypothetical protein
MRKLIESLLQKMQILYFPVIERPLVLEKELKRKECYWRRQKFLTCLQMIIFLILFQEMFQSI